ncbi:type IV-A pilus assembly ATPase PilB [Candidatus Desantisbacteria bacterium CG_4_10_14_0_8_um_filter_48_22]|uniref:Type IV-A pilus assembly ATPase PilB n=1 Tax=Candidatus Desantisbacteria bacterium CG_4_10_14_0_8_um_filter_48_22 TaxID=1974543 RepID=A0A2M7S5A4_9BACT|nr:MAG: type IV-A pilus assembly ATPase PilB [Candidatus Desantisbacteria bacterium CG02_land_8_20_14_3_00_49_13]PIZ14732.1 MAG: type IV-A pilus assembly ATPase PilB [Candidatus Desantisbacteria bacterium CG_4_10_14_0_8_um_filter_48_22]PJB28585.1 MAG: type IV-A pilus assembly ATPase PilB [Candidatus Desantisbacteria bacterium CG_4_9_14_3_um_filter_50_7]
MKKKMFGEILIEKKIVTEEQLKQGLENSKKEGGTLGQALVRMGLVTDDDMKKHLSDYYGVPYVNIKDYEIDKAALASIPENLIRKYRVFPLDKIGNNLTIATTEVTNVVIFDELRMATGCNITPMLTSEQDINSALEKYFGKKTSMEDALKQITDQEHDIELHRDSGIELDVGQIQVAADETPVVKLVTFIIGRAVDDGASDIHLEPYEKEFRLRYRIDGILYEIKPPPPKQLQNPIIARIKIMSNMDIAETRVPQDGRIRLTTKGKIVDFRVSTFPTVFGEKIVLRLLDKANLQPDLTKLGFEKEELGKFEKAIAQPYGMILVTGPTGSGKSTTLYSVLSTLNTSRANIVTVEEPVEYQVKGINQVQVNAGIGLTFAMGLRAILRQDPNIVMVGEIRDQETAEIAVKAALTGHLVLSTLHTNDSVGAISRLIDMGIEPFLVSSAVTLIAAQRLLRRICNQCREAYTPTPKMLEDIGIKPKPGEQILFYKGMGCDYCKNTGYKGRLAVYEILTLNKHLRELIVKRANVMVLQEIARKEEGMRTLRESAMLKVRNGITTVEEAAGITMQEEA